MSIGTAVENRLTRFCPYPDFFVWDPNPDFLVPVPVTFFPKNN
jgi:hypothetical protein